jgi:hypothetical protein
MVREENTELELSTDELVDVALGINATQPFDLNVDLDSIDVDDVISPTMKLSDGEHHASLLSSFLLENSLYLGVKETISFQKLVGNLNKMIATNLGRQHQRSLDSYFKSPREYLYLFGVISYCFHTIYILYMA